jgi:hypothetical protein
MSTLITFGQTWALVQDAVRRARFPEGSEIWFLRGLTGRILVYLEEKKKEEKEIPEPTRQRLQPLLEILKSELGAHAYSPDRAVISLTREELEALRPEAIIHEVDGVRLYLVDREMTARRWATISDLPGPRRFVFFALKGGLGRSTTVAVLAAHLAKEGERVLVMDFDLESPSLSSMLSPEELPEFGIVEWLVEDLVDQADSLLPDMVGHPSWSTKFSGEVMVVPACGKVCQEYLAQLGRAYRDKPPAKLGDVPEIWVARIQRLVKRLEAYTEPTVVLLDSRNGLHDAAAALITSLQAQVLLFAVNSEPTWAGYRMLFQHWAQNQVIRQIRERLWLVAALIPPPDLDRDRNYLPRFREQAWELFREWLYDEEPSGEEEPFSYAPEDESAPHYPLPIYWQRGLLAIPSLRSLNFDEISPGAYGEFLSQFDQRLLGR